MRLRSITRAQLSDCSGQFGRGPQDKFLSLGARGCFLSLQGVINQTLGNLVKAYRAGTQKGVHSKPAGDCWAEESGRLRAELGSVRMKSEIVRKAMTYFVWRKK